MSLDPKPTPLAQSPNTLRSLLAYAPDQGEHIKSLLDRDWDSKYPLFQHLEKGDRWSKLWCAAWKKDMDSLDELHTVERGSPPIDDSLIPDAVPHNCYVMSVPGAMYQCWPGISCKKSKKIFIRPGEYEEAEESTISACRDERENCALLVTGQPGIGSSLFHFRAMGP